MVIFFYLFPFESERFWFWIKITQFKVRGNKTVFPSKRSLFIYLFFDTCPFNRVLLVQTVGLSFGGWYL